METDAYVSHRVKVKERQTSPQRGGEMMLAPIVYAYLYALLGT